MRPGLLYEMLSMISLNLGGSEHLLPRLSCIVSHKIPFLLDEVLEFAPPAKITVPQNVFHLKFFFSVHQFQGWSKVIGSFLFCFVIGG